MKKQLLLTLLGSFSLTAFPVVPPAPKWGAPDTLAHYQVGPGSIYTHIHFPDKPLHVYVTKVDLTNPYNKMEQYQSNNRVPDKPRETTLSQTRSNSSPGHKVYAGINHDFYDFSTLHICIGLNARNGDLMYGGGWGRSALVIDKSKKAYVIEPRQESEVIFADKSKTRIDYFNSGYSGPGEQECILFNKYNSLTLSKAGFYVQVIPQSELLINGQPTPCVVKEISDLPLQTSATDYVLFFQYGKADIARQKVNKGDIVYIDQKLIQGKFGSPGTDILQVLHGYPSIVKDGVFHEGEYNDFENGREKEVSPHTMAGVSKDGKTLYLFAVDGRSSHSIGTTCLDIAGYLVADGAWDVVNFDSGGSTTMVVNDKTVNVPSDGSERLVMDSFHAISLAPEDNVITDISFNQPCLNTIAGAKSLLPVIGFNQYGDLLTENLENVTLINSDKTTGVMQGKSYVALRGNSTDCIKAIFGSIQKSFQVRVFMPDSFRIQTRNAIVGKDPVNLPVTGILGKKLFELDGQALQWRIEDPSVCKVENGILTGLKNGKTKLTAQLEDLTDEIEVRVEMLEGIHLIEDFTNHESFTLSSTSNIKNMRLSSEGLPQEMSGANLIFDFAKGRASSVSVEKSILFQGQPDSLLLTLDIGNITAKSLMVYLSNEKESRGWSYALPVPLNNKLSTLRIPLLNKNGEKLASDEFPLNFNKLNFMLDDRAMNAASYSIYLQSAKAKYGDSNLEVSVPQSSEVEGIILFPNPVADEITLKYDLTKRSLISFLICSMDGRICKSVSKDLLEPGTYTDRFNVSDLKSGIYLLIIKTDKGLKTMKILKK
ncbi:MAG: phosphodiester glycosidase family protein [Bacteroidales bacterium]